MNTIRLLVAGAAAVAAIGLVPATAQAAEGEATVSVLHGVPGATVDVYANGEELLTGFEPGTLTDPLELPAGDYDLKVVAAGAGADGEAVIKANGVTVPADANITVVAHLDADGTPVLTPFVNDTAPSGEGARLTGPRAHHRPLVPVLECRRRRRDTAGVHRGVELAGQPPGQRRGAPRVADRHLPAEGHRRPPGTQPRHAQ